jgi:hypothetical protein
MIFYYLNKKTMTIACEARDKNLFSGAWKQYSTLGHLNIREALKRTYDLHGKTI